MLPSTVIFNKYCICERGAALVSFFWLGDIVENYFATLLNTKEKYKKYIRFNEREKAVVYILHNVKNGVNVLDGQAISDIITFIYSVHCKWKNVNIPIVFYFGKVKVQDKLTYIIFECICYTLREQFRHKLTIRMQLVRSIHSEGIYTSGLACLNQHGALTNEFNNRFKFILNSRHFRKLVKYNALDTAVNLGEIQSDISCFLSHIDYVAASEEEFIEDISEMMIELVGNALEHGKADCIMDIDVSYDNYDSHLQGDYSRYYGINIVVFNCGGIEFNHELKEKLSSFAQGVIKKPDGGDVLVLYNRYEELMTIRKKHNDMFDEEYGDDDFCNIAALQDRISGRPELSLSGGKGLTVLIKSLQSKMDNEYCYLLSGNGGIRFKDELIKYDSHNWLGFNKEFDFTNKRPACETILRCPIYIPGTAFNLTFVKGHK